MTISEQIAGTLKTQRRRLGLTLEQTAELAEVSRNTVRNLERGASPDCSLGVAERICAAVGLELTLGIRGAKTRTDDPFTTPVPAAGLPGGMIGIPGFFSPYSSADNRSRR